MDDNATPRPWKCDVTTVYTLDETGTCNRFSATMQPGFVRGKTPRTSFAEIKANAALILRAVNAHDALVGVVEGVVAYDAILKRYSGPLELLCAGDVAEIDAAYDALVASALAAIKLAAGK